MKDKEEYIVNFTLDLMTPELTITVESRFLEQVSQEHYNKE
jgi:hypothetical protein